jgi:hypothetical protein
VLAAGVSNASATQTVCSGRAATVFEKGTGGAGTFTIEAKAPKHPQVGDTVRIPVVVTRPAEQDPLGQGVPVAPTELEAGPGINVLVGLSIGDVFLYRSAVTDDRGKATIKIKIEKYVKPGPVDASFHAWKTHARLPCLRLYEYGERLYGKFFSVKR